MRYLFAFPMALSICVYHLHYLLVLSVIKPFKLSKVYLYLQQQKMTQQFLEITPNQIFIIAAMSKHLKIQAVTGGVLWEKVFLEILQNSQKKSLCQSLFFNKVTGLSPATLLKKRLWHGWFPVNFAKFLRIPILQNTYGRLLLKNVRIRSIDRYSIIRYI